MKRSPPWQLVLRSYRNAEDPRQQAKYPIWQAAIGLQGVDGLNPSPYFVKLVQSHIEGRLTLAAMEKQLYRHYKWHKRDMTLSEETWEADLVSLHIAQLLSDHSFQMDPLELQKIHHSLFKDVYDFAGNFRNYDIRKQEWILDGESVKYIDCDRIEDSLNRVFSAEKKFDYRSASTRDGISHLARFISQVWIIHPYGEGNTRTTSLFLMRYLQSMGIRMQIDVFLDSWSFRNALVRANYADLEKNISPDPHFAELFLQNMLLKKENPLRNQELHVDYPNIN